MPTIISAEETSLGCHPERRKNFAKRSSYEVEEPALSEAEWTPSSVDQNEPGKAFSRNALE
jgi:hypothetical protein